MSNKFVWIKNELHQFNNHLPTKLINLDNLQVVQIIVIQDNF